jgi:hypothetical protein
VFNPAIAGSKDFFSIDLISNKFGNSNSQVLNGNARLKRANHNYFSAPNATEYAKIAVGGLVFNELNGLSRNIGIGGTGAYHFQLKKDGLSYLSVGVTGKAIYNKYSGDPDLGRAAKSTLFPDFDAGLYYYNTNLFAGLSATNILGHLEDPDSTGFYSIQASRQLFFLIGYKIVLSKSLNILLEPSIIINTGDSIPSKKTDMIKPSLKLYAGDFCVGTYFNDFSKLSFFAQYKYPAFYVATYFEVPKGSPFYKNPFLAEFALGLNISAIKSRSSIHNHW